MKGLLLKDLYIAKSNILVTIVCLIVLGFGLSFLLEASALLVLAPPCVLILLYLFLSANGGKVRPV